MSVRSPDTTHDNAEETMRRVHTRWLAAAIVALPLAAAAQEPAASPAAKLSNPMATREAQQLYGFLLSVQGKYVLSGQHNYVASGSAFTGRVQELTARLPLIWGSDFSFAYAGKAPEKFQHAGPINLTPPGTTVRYTGGTPRLARREVSDQGIKAARHGHIITLMWHMCPPQIGDRCDGTEIWTVGRQPNQQWWDELTTDGTKLNTAWKAQVDAIATYLGHFRDAEIPVLWRPYHEMNGVWFWWGNKKGPNGFAKLWRMMYDRYVNHHRLHNLIWVWNANAPRTTPGDEAFAYADFYPGDAYVDVLAADVYHEDWKQSHHDELLALAKGKPIALGEVGNPPPGETLAAQPKWTWFMLWGNLAFHGNNPERLKVLLEDPRVLTHDEVERDKDGVYKVTPKKDPPPRPPAEPEPSADKPADEHSDKPVPPVKQP
jgi:mannan endo-1,4-beta-mannosidase